MQDRSLGQEDALEEGTATLSSILAWESHEQRRLEGSSPQHCKESDTTEATKHRKALPISMGTEAERIEY